jgi:hypothetical protein
MNFEALFKLEKIVQCSVISGIPPLTLRGKRFTVCTEITIILGTVRFMIRGGRLRYKRYDAHFLKKSSVFFHKRYISRYLICITIRITIRFIGNCNYSLKSMLVDMACFFLIWGRLKFFYPLFIYVLMLEIQLSREGSWDHINQFYIVTFLFLSQARTWFFTIVVYPCRLSKYIQKQGQISFFTPAHFKSYFSICVV